MRKSPLARLSLVLPWCWAFAPLASGCRAAPEPSPAYAECARIWEETLRERGSDAYADPRAAEAQKLCATVPAESLDATAAQALAKRIGDGRAELVAQERRLAEAIVVERAPQEVAIDIAPVAPPPAGEAPDGGSGAAQAPEVGSPAEAFKTRYGACVRLVEKFTEKGGKREGELWALDSAKPACAKDFPEIAGKTVALLDGKVFNVVESGKVERSERRETVDAGFVVVDAGAPPPGPPTIKIEDLGRVLPGQPLPEGGVVQ